SDSASVRPHSGGLDLDPVVRVFPLAAQQRRIIIHVVDDDVRISVVVEITESAASTQRRPRKAGPRPGGHVLEASVAQVAKEDARLAVCDLDLDAGALQLRIDVAVTIEEIEPAGQ